MRTPRFVPAALSVWLVASCGNGSEPSPPGSGEPEGLWDARIEGIQAILPGVGPVACSAAWVMAIEPVDPPPTLLTRIPYTTSLQCGSTSGGWGERGRTFLVQQAGDSIALIDVARADTFLVAGFAGNGTLRGRMADVNYLEAAFRATRRSSSTDPNRAPYELVVGSPWPDLEVGDSVQAEAQVYDAYLDRIPNAPVLWASSDESIATVDATGMVYGLVPGSATITGSIGTLAQSVAITVLEPPASVAIVSAPDSIIQPGSGELQAVARGPGGEVLPGRRFHWTSSDPEVATVTEYGETAAVTGVGPGAATITARSTTVSASVTLPVLPAVAEIAIAGAPGGGLTIGDSVQLTATTLDSEGNLLTGRPVSWTFESVAAGVAVTSSGLVWSTRADTGRISAHAEGATATVVVPVRMDGRLTALAAGDGHTCGLSTAGTVYCWGHPGDGRLGPDQGGGGPGAVPIALPGDPTIVALEAGALHTCALEDTGAAFCWGADDNGELGQPPGDEGEVHVVGTAETFQSLSLGAGFSCGVTGGGEVHCWGGNFFGELGRGATSAGVNAPGPVTGSHQFTQVAAGANHACGLTLSGQAWCWGDNQFGELGLGSTDAEPHPAPVHAAPDLSFTALAAGGTRVCGITTGGPVVCWGQGQPQPAEVEGSTGLTRITGGGLHFCGANAAGQMVCWGETDRFNLGYRPAEAVGAFTAGLIHTCAIRADGDAVCWGFNDGGQIGAADFASRGPVEVMGQPE